MNTYLQYLERGWLKTNSAQLDIIRQGQEFKIYLGDEPLTTAQGNEFCFSSERVAQLIVTDLTTMASTIGATVISPALFAFQKDVFEPAGDQITRNWQSLIMIDPVVTMKSAGRFNFQPFSPDDDLFSFAFITFSSLVRSVNAFVNLSMSEFDVSDSDLPPFTELVALSYQQLTPEKKVVLQALSSSHDAGIVLPLLLISGILSPSEYTKGLIALKIHGQGASGQILLDVVRAVDYLECLEQKGSGTRQISSIIHEGETDTVEFKSTLRWDIRAAKTNPAIERAALKTVAGFLNSSGGNLLIGVRDDGSVEGIETDKFANDDKFLLHLWTLIRTTMGRDVSPCIRTTLEKMEEKTVCLVQCRQSNRPVFLRQSGFDEAFYIRVGPSSNALDISEALKYIADHFKP